MKVLLQMIKTGYSWEISVQGKNIAEIPQELRSANAALKREYGGSNGLLGHPSSLS
jgi:hypothetical protein